MGKYIVKNIKENLSSQYSKKRLDHTKQSARDALKTVSKTAIQKTAEVTGNLFGNKIADRVTKVLISSPHNNSKTVTNDKKIPKERYISPEGRLLMI